MCSKDYGEVDVFKLYDNLKKECNKYYNIKANGFDLTEKGIKFNFLVFNYKDFDIRELVLSPGYAFYQNNPEDLLPKNLINEATCYLKLIKKGDK